MVTRITLEECRDGSISVDPWEAGTVALQVVPAADYDALNGELMSLSQNDGKLERALKRAEEQIAKLDAELAAARAVIEEMATRGMASAKYFLTMFPRSMAMNKVIVRSDLNNKTRYVFPAEDEIAYFRAHPDEINVPFIYDGDWVREDELQAWRAARMKDQSKSEGATE